MKILTTEQYMEIEEEYDMAVRSLNRITKLKRLADKVETGVYLLGCTAIQDNLQEKVPESIKRFLEANIRVWMITGDKFETADNIAACTGLTDEDTFVYRMRHSDEKEFPAKVLELKRMVQQQKANTRKAIIMDTTKTSTLRLTRFYFWY